MKRYYILLLIIIIAILFNWNNGSTSSFWTHSALVFSWATSRKDCSTSQVARQSEKSL